jgi:hypothetical protein
MQLPLPDITTDDTSLAGLLVHLPRRCKCGHGTFVTGAGRGPHRASLYCGRCRRHSGWLSNEAATFLEKVIGHFGRPTDPIVVRQGDSA